MSLFSLEECAACENKEERVFVDSWTGTRLCLECLGSFWERLSNSPESGGDNLKELIEEIK